MRKHHNLHRVVFLLWLAQLLSLEVNAQKPTRTSLPAKSERDLSQHSLTSQSPDVHVDRSDLGMVVSDSAAASRVGSEVLRRGGNAVDAAIATAFALAVTWPDAGNIGGGGFMMIRPADGKNPRCIDYREVAPQTMQANSFTKTDTTFAHKAVGVPGTVRGLELAHQQYGQMPWRELVLPAVKLARDGVQVDAPLAKTLNQVLSEERIKRGGVFAEFKRVFGHPDQRYWEAGDRLIQKDLAKTLELIANEGAKAFYSGFIADLITEEMKRGNGEITLQDLKNYQAISRDVIRGKYREYTILAAPPPSSGGTCIVEALNILESFNLRELDRYDPKTIHLIAEAMRRAFADRAMHLGDPDFTDIPKHLTEKVYAAGLAKEIDKNHATSSHLVGPPITEGYESPDTTHFSVVDPQGMAVSNTYTLEATWGSRIVVQGAGFILNNEMGDFNWFPGETNTLGRIGTEPNQLQGGKRMLSSQCPVILERDGNLVMVTGSPGGRTIINTVLCILLNYIDFQYSPARAVSSMRMHQQWFPDQILLEAMDQLPHSRIANRLAQMGHKVANRPAQGAAHTIAIEDKDQIRIGISDYRRSGRPASLRSANITTWHFSEPPGTSLDLTQSTGHQPLQWSGRLTGATTNGHDQLRLSGTSKKASGVPRSVSESIGSKQRQIVINKAIAQIPSITGLPEKIGNYAIEIKLNDSHFTDQASDEVITFSLGEGSAQNREHRLKLNIGLSEKKQLCVWMECDQNRTEQMQIASQSQLMNPTLLRMQLDTISNQALVKTRPASAGNWKDEITLKLSKRIDPDHVEITYNSDVFTSDDWVEIDRIEILGW